MDYISDYDLKYLDNIIIPGFLKAKIIDKLGIANVIFHYDEIGDKFKLFRRDYLLLLMQRYRKNELIEFFKHFEARDNVSFSVLQKVLGHDRVFSRKIIQVLDIPVLDKLLSSKIYNISLVADLYKYRKKDTYTLLDNAINNDSYQKYINYDTPDEVSKYIVTKISVASLMNDIIYRSSNSKLCELIIKYRENDINNYVINHSNNILELKELLKLKLPEFAYKTLLAKYPLDDDIISFIYEFGEDKLKDLLLSLYEDKVKLWLDSLIEDDSYLDKIKYQSEQVISYVMIKISKEQVNSLIQNNKLLYYDKIVKELYRYRKQDIIDIILENVAADSLNIVKYLEFNIPDDVLNEVIERIKIDDIFLEKILESGKEEVIKNIFKLYKKELLTLIRNDSKEDRFAFLEKYLKPYRYPLVLQEELINDLSDEEIIYILEKSYFRYNIKDAIFKKYKDKIGILYKELLVNDSKKAKDIFTGSSSTDLRSYLVKELDFETLFSLLDSLGSGERDILYKRFPKELVNKLTEEKNIDLIKFFQKKVAYSSDIIANISLSLLSYDDIIKVICNGISLNYYILNNKPLLELLSESVNAKANEIMKWPYDECLVFLKSLRKDFDDLFTVFINSINFTDEFLHKLFIERGLSDNQKKILYEFKQDEILRIVEDKILNDEIDPLEYVQKGTPEDILSLALTFIDKDRIISLVNDPSFVNRRSIGKNFAAKLVVRTYVDPNNVLVVDDLIKCYSGDSFDLIKNYEKIQEFLIYNDIDVTKFWQYSLNNSYNFIHDASVIYEEDLEEFLFVKEILFKYVYNSCKEFSYKDFFELIKNYTRYKDLCLSLIECEDLETVNFNNIKLLFSQSYTMSDINSYKDCDNIIERIKNSYMLKAKACTSLLDYRTLLLQILFNSDSSKVNIMLSNYGGICELLELKYYNLHNPKVLEKIDSIIPYTELMEDIVSCDDIDALKVLLDETLANLDSVLIDFNFTNYDELMRELFAIEMDVNLSKVGHNMDLNKVKLVDKSNLYGLDVYDFRDKQYTLLAHVISNSETIEDLIDGKSSGTRNFISLSAISHRMQAFYYNARDMILGYDEMPFANFVCSSNRNMGSNGAIQNNSSEVGTISRTQRGVLEVSDTSGNSEILSLREGIKPKYIICPGRYPYNKEIEYALKYNLKIVLTQPIGKFINSPKDVSIEPKECNVNKDYLIEFRNKVKRVNNKRKIAILTDSHGIFEPTLTVLEDMRKRGITEIYSLGDNIGTGSNPAEVVETLEHYGVRSIKGNHEKYLLDGVDEYKTHLDKTGAYDTEKVNTDWTYDQLDDDQIDALCKYDDFIELEIEGKKILLCHYLYDYNTGELLYDISKYDLVIQGHKHFFGVDGNVITLKAVGMGNKDYNDQGNATYMIIYTEDGELKQEYVSIPYAYKNSVNDANISTNNSREKIINWISK